MTINTTEVWQEALGEIGTRSTITGAPPADNSQEAFYCNMFYESVVEQALRAAHWNFAKKSDQLSLWKALPGTPENQSQPLVSGWLPLLYPAPPWTYSYAYPLDCIQVRSVLGQPQQVPFAPPIFSGTFQLAPPLSHKLPAGKFEVSTDAYDAAGNAVLTSRTCFATPTPPTVVSGGTGYKVGDIVNAANPTPPPGYVKFGFPCQLLVTALTGSAISTAQLITSNNNLSSGYFPPPIPTNPIGVTGGSGSGATFNLSLSPYANIQKVILTNLEQAIIEYTFLQSTEQLWDPDFVMVIINALAGKLAIPLTGDKALARDKIVIANNMILEARVRDANEGFTVNDHMPDWLRVRGVGGGLGYEMYFYPFGPLFPVSPLV